MESVRSFSGFPGLSEMQTFLASNDTPFVTSELYSSEQDAKIVDPELRQSRFRVFQDCKIFRLIADPLIRWLNETDDNYSYQLRWDNITETRYEAGGHFLKHKDFLSVTSNLIEEFTLLMCVTPDSLTKKATVMGGETLIFPYASEKGTAFDTTKSGNGLLFRKDLDHAGGLLKAGEKHILTANLWATRKQTSDQVLSVTFPETADESASGASAQAQLDQVARQDTSYALPVDCLKGTMLDAHVRFVNQNYEGTEERRVVTYECTNFGFEEFGTVFKILVRSYVDEHHIRDHAACIDFFGPCSNENVLVNLALNNNKPNNLNASCERFVKPDSVKSPSKKMRATTDGHLKSDELSNQDVIVCENESRTKVVYEVAQKLGFDNYVPFKMIFVDGVIATGYYDFFETVSMTPVALAVGDYNHVFGIQKFEIIEASTLKDLHENHAFDFRSSRFLDDYESDDDYNYEEIDEFTCKARGLGLKVAMGEGDVRRGLTQYISNCGSGEDAMLDPRFLFSQLSDFLGDPSDGKKNGEESEEKETPNLFHRDEKGKVTFTEAEADAAGAFIAAMNLDMRVKGCLQEKRFELPQETEEYDQYYCNESTYANFDILFVTGLVKLDNNSVKSFPKPHFDAWPTPEQEERRVANIEHHFTAMQIPVPRGLGGDY